MSYIALYRAYRPQNFSDVAGQEVIVQTLRNAVTNNKIGHAYLFSGPRGTGKTSLAKIFAKTINCTNVIDGNPCEKCDACLSFTKNEANDIIEIDGASNNGVDEIRDLRDKVKYLPGVGKYKVYIIDEVHMLTTGAFNALLKTLEEPPAHVVFILATTEVHKIPATILSRCQRYDFKNIDLENIIKRINYIVTKEDIKITSDAVETIAINAHGGLRDALSLLDQAVSFTNDEITEDDINQIIGAVSKADLVELLTFISNNEASSALKLINTFLSKGSDEERIIADLIVTLKDLLLAKVEYNGNKLFSDLKRSISTNKIYHYLDVLIEMQNNMRFTYQKRLYLEIAIIQMIEHEDIHAIDLNSSILELRKEIEFLKQNGLKVQPKKKQKGRELVSSSDIQAVLYEASHDKKNYLENLVYNNQPSNPELEMAHHLLKSTKLAAASSDSVVFTHDNLALANELMQDTMSNDVLKILNEEANQIKNYFVILESDWLSFRTKYVTLLKSGQKRPNVGSYDFKIYEVVVEDEVKQVKESLRLAKEYFGEDIIEIKE